jgi:integrase
VDLLSSLVNRLLIHLGIKATKSLYQLRPIDFARYIHQRRVDDYSSGIVNTEVAYLNQMAREIKTHTGIDVAETLLLELPEFMQRHPFTNREIIRILDTVATMGARGEQWRTLILIMLYTGLRPADAAHLRYQDFTLEKGVINIKPSKTSRYRANPPKPKPLHDALALHLQALFASKPYQPGDFLCPLLASRKHMDLAMHFQRIMAKANINRVVVRKTKSGKFYAKSLYSLRCTSNTLLTAMGASREQAMVELDQTSDRAHRHYEFNGDARIMARRRAIINQLPGLFDPPGPPDLL